MSYFVTLRQNNLSNQNLNDQFSQPLELDENKDYEIALLECVFPSRIGQISRRENFGTIEVSSDDPEDYRLYELVASYHHGVKCSKLSSFIEYINRQHLKSHGAALDIVKSAKGGDRLRFSDNNSSRKVRIKFKEKVAAILGFEPNTFYSRGDSLFNLDLDAGTYNLFLYGDCIKDTLVGDSLVPLFRIITVQKNVDFTHKVFETPHYIPLNVRYLNHIRLLVCDVAGKTVTLPEGLANFVFHIREIKKKYESGRPPKLQTTHRMQARRATQHITKTVLQLS